MTTTRGRLRALHAEAVRQHVHFEKHKWNRESARKAVNITIALLGLTKMLLTSDMRTVFDADAMLVHWSDSVAGHHLLLQAALLATWPEDDNTPALAVV